MEFGRELVCDVLTTYELDSVMEFGFNRSYLVHTLDRFANEGWFNCDQVII